MNLRELKRGVRSLTPKELVKLDDWLHKLIDATESMRPDRRAAAKGKVLKVRQTTHMTYRLEGVRCGKENCKCARGELHGPYWYAYWSEGGKTKSEYVGKRLPESQER